MLVFTHLSGFLASFLTQAFVEAFIVSPTHVSLLFIQHCHDDVSLWSGDCQAAANPLIYMFSGVLLLLR